MTTPQAPNPARLLTAACMVAALAGCGSLHAGQVPGLTGATGHQRPGARPAAASPRQRAAADAASILASFRPPPGARRSAVLPAGAPRALAQPPQRPATPDLVDDSAWWQVRGDPQAVLGWVSAHRPHGFSRFGDGSEGPAGSPTTWWDVFRRPAVRNVLIGRDLIVSVGATGSGLTAIRVDAQVEWLPARPRSERIPPAATVVVVSAVNATGSAGQPGHADRSVTVTRRAAVARISTLIDRLPVFPPGSRSCPADTGKELKMTFKAGLHGRVLAVAVASVGGCEAVSLTIGGQGQPALAGGRSLARHVLSVIGAHWPGLMSGL